MSNIGLIIALILAVGTPFVIIVGSIVLIIVKIIERKKKRKMKILISMINIKLESIAILICMAILFCMKIKAFNKHYYIKYLRIIMY